MVTALAVVVMLGLGSLFLSWSTEYAPAIYSLLFGEVLGVSANEVGLTALLGVLSIAAVVVLYRPLLLSLGRARDRRGRGSADPPDRDALPGARGPHRHHVRPGGRCPVDVHPDGGTTGRGAVVGRPAGRRHRASRWPIALVTVWVSIAASYETNWPIGFFVGTIGAVAYVVGRTWAWWRTGRVADGPPPRVTAAIPAPGGGPGPVGTATSSV